MKRGVMKRARVCLRVYALKIQVRKSRDGPFRVQGRMWVYPMGMPHRRHGPIGIPSARNTAKPFETPEVLSLPTSCRFLATEADTIVTSLRFFLPLTVATVSIVNMTQHSSMQNAPHDHRGRITLPLGD